MIRPRKALTLILAFISLVALTSCSNSDAPNSSSKTITIAQVEGWDDDVAITALWKHLLEEKGYTVNLVSLDVAVAFTGMSRGDVDAYMGAWLPSTHKAYLAKVKQDVTVLKPWNTNDRMVLAVPDFVDAKTISEVASNPSEYGNQIVGIEPGAGEMEILPRDVMPAYGMGKWDLVKGSTPAMLAQLKKAVQNRTPIVTALWTPHWAFSEMDIRPLVDDKHAWPAADGTSIVLSNEFAQANPEVVSWFRNTQLTDEQTTSLMGEVHSATSPAAAVKTWLKDNGDVVAHWTEGDK